MDRVGGAFFFRAQTHGGLRAGARSCFLAPFPWSLHCERRERWFGSWFLSFLFWTTSFAWSHRPAKGPMKLTPDLNRPNSGSSMHLATCPTCGTTIVLDFVPVAGMVWCHTCEKAFSPSVQAPEPDKAEENNGDLNEESDNC
jgi:hypothetical protein